MGETRQPGRGSSVRAERSGRRLAFSMLLSVSVHAAVLALLYAGAFVLLPRLVPQWLTPEATSSRLETRSGVPGASGEASKGSGIPGVPTPVALIRGLSSPGPRLLDSDAELAHPQIKLPRIKKGPSRATGMHEPAHATVLDDRAVTLVAFNAEALRPPDAASREEATHQRQAGDVHPEADQPDQPPQTPKASLPRPAGAHARVARGGRENSEVGLKTVVSREEDRTAAFRTEAGGELPDSVDTGGLAVAPAPPKASPLPEDESFASHAPRVSQTDRDLVAQSPGPSAEGSSDSQAQAKQALEDAMSALRLAESGGEDPEVALRDAREALARAEHLVRRDGHASDSALDGPTGSGMGSKDGPGGTGEGNSLDLLVQERVSHVAEIVGAATARRVSRSGAARVRFNVDARGYVHGQTVLHSSGSPELDREIPVILHLAEPYPGPGQTYVVVVEFHPVRYAPIMGE